MFACWWGQTTEKTWVLPVAETRLTISELDATSQYPACSAKAAPSIPFSAIWLMGKVSHSIAQHWQGLEQKQVWTEAQWWGCYVLPQGDIYPCADLQVWGGKWSIVRLKWWGNGIVLYCRGRTEDMKCSSSFQSLSQSKPPKKYYFLLIELIGDFWQMHTAQTSHTIGYKISSMSLTCLLAIQSPRRSKEWLGTLLFCSYF